MGFIAKRKFLVAGLMVYLLLLTVVAVSVKDDDKRQSSGELTYQSYISKVSPVGKTHVTDKTIAQKLDLQRKVITVSSGKDIAKIQSLIEKQGGEIEKKTNTMIVARFPKESDTEITKSIEDSGVSKVGTDYPIAISADTEDWGVMRIKAPDVWTTTKADGIKVAVIDTGVDYHHPDLQARYGGGIDIVNNDLDPSDDNGHGTHVSGIIAATTDNGGYVGVAPNVQILGIKVLGSDGAGYISDVVAGIDWAMSHGAQVMNFSLGTSYNSSVLESKLNEAYAKGIVLVAAAGNTSGGPVLYPAAYGSVISVAATDTNDRLASFSSLGAEISAPGVGITSTVPGGGYATWSGTSMASPHVAATAALMIANHQANIRDSLHKSALDLGAPGTDGLFGYGLVNAKTAALGEDTLAPIVTIISPENNATVTGNVTINFTVQDENILKSTKLLINDSLKQEWTATPSAYSWDTTNLSEGAYTILVQSVDATDNLGEAKVTVAVSKNKPTAAPSITNAPWLQQGKSAEVRQDVANENAAENRQNYEHQPEKDQGQQNTASSPQENSASAPDTTNINERNQKSESSPGHSEEKGNNGKSDVKGAATASTFWGRLVLWFTRVFQ